MRIRMWTLASLVMAFSMAPLSVADEYSNYLQRQAAQRAQQQREYQQKLSIEAAQREQLRREQQRQLQERLRHEAAVRDQQQREYRERLRIEAEERDRQRKEQQRQLQERLRYEAAERDRQQREYAERLRIEAANRETARRIQENNTRERLRIEAANRETERRIREQNYRVQSQYNGSSSYSTPTYNGTYSSSYNNQPPHSSSYYTQAQQAPQRSAEVIATPKPEPASVKSKFTFKLPEGARMYQNGNLLTLRTYEATLSTRQTAFFILDIALEHEGKSLLKQFQIEYKGGEDANVEISLERFLNAESGLNKLTFEAGRETTVPTTPPFTRDLLAWNTRTEKLLAALSGDARRDIDEDARVDQVYFKSEKDSLSKIGDDAVKALAANTIEKEVETRTKFRQALAEDQELLSERHKAAQILEFETATSDGVAKRTSHQQRATALEQSWNASWQSYQDFWAAEKDRRAEKYRPMMYAVEAAKRYLAWEAQSKTEDENWYQESQKKYVEAVREADLNFVATQNTAIENIKDPTKRAEARKQLDAESKRRETYRATVQEQLEAALKARHLFLRRELLAVLDGYFTRKPNFHEAHKRRFATEMTTQSDFDEALERAFQKETELRTAYVTAASSLLSANSKESTESFARACADSRYALESDDVGSLSLLYKMDGKSTVLATAITNGRQWVCHNDSLVGVVADAEFDGDSIELSTASPLDVDGLTARKHEQSLVLVWYQGKLVRAQVLSEVQVERIDRILWDAGVERFRVVFAKGDGQPEEGSVLIREDGGGGVEAVGTSEDLKD